MPSEILTAEEEYVVNVLAQAWHGFQTFKVLHPADAEDFQRAIRSAQNIVMARPATKEQYLRDAAMKKAGG